ncbi:hypothetical protein KZZ52_10455 [Dactylosporangium sp. AC04546]|uniref:hypothetical protein n=1 Tax=Dactylosporangium sp. AC04546 TaxID=2862460 RepID=UPI002E7C0044|nr:hypothetical protein [Dactylosporangium sp. AC04546]WVK85779.1 hypothetical protein KZZ52_10455 [Dactylosporangium sp. AC04546]
MFTIVASSTTMSCAIAMTASASQRRGSGGTDADLTDMSGTKTVSFDMLEASESHEFHPRPHSTDEVRQK